MILDDIVAIDRQITLAINSFHTPFTDAIWKFFSGVQIWFPMYAAIIIWMFFRLGWKRAIVFTVMFALMVFCCDQCANFVKDTVQRLRPCRDEAMLAAGLYAPLKGSMYGFYSGHAANSFGLAACSTVALTTDTKKGARWFIAWIYTWCVCVSLSRVFLAMHFFGDITVGAIAGTLTGLALAYLGRFICRKFIR